MPLGVKPFGNAQNDKFAPNIAPIRTVTSNNAHPFTFWMHMVHHPISAQELRKCRQGEIIPLARLAMFPGIDRLKMLKVRDVMSRKVREISVNQTMSEAAKAFAQSDVSSAPVVDDQGRCVGMLSAADFIKRDCPQGNDMVSCYMTAALQSVAACESLLQAARVMSAEHIHHLPVLEDERPIGVVSTMDIVAALITAVDEVEVQLMPRDV